jgi:MipA family protein
VSPSRAWFATLLVLVQAPVWADGAGGPELSGTSNWELGIGLGAVRYPVYDGAFETQYLTVPFPYVVYHDPHLSVTNSRVRGIVIARSNWSLDVDFSGQPYVESDRTRERVGMTDLDWLGEAGPALRYLAWEAESQQTELDLVLPVRAAVSVQGLTLHHRGYVFAPRLELDHDLSDQPRRLEWDADLTAVFDDRGYDQYYYAVTPRFATAKRPAYDAPGGYAGYRAELGCTLYRGALVYGAFIKYTSLKGAVFLDSPLVARSDGLSFGVSVSWIIQQSHP